MLEIGERLAACEAQMMALKQWISSMDTKVELASNHTVRLKHIEDRLYKIDKVVTGILIIVGSTILLSMIYVAVTKGGPF